MSAGEPVNTLEYPAESVEIPKESVYRYLGLGTALPDAALEALIEKSLAEFRSAVRFRACCAEVPIAVTEDAVDFGAFSAPGRSLARRLSGCGRAILFAATAGAETEQQRRKAAVLSPARALVLDAIGTAAVESFCDALCTRWDEEYGGALRSRFSPGYGDLPLAVQRPLLSFLDSGRRAGIVLTEALLMIPQKSVSAVVGIGRTGRAARAPDCASCEKPDCAFRL